MSIPVNAKQSKVFPVAGGAIEVQLDAEFAHNFVAVYSCDANGEPLADYSGLSGKYDLLVLSTNCPVYQKPLNAAISAKAPTDASIAGNLLKVKVTPDTITGATYFRVHTSQNIT